MTVLGILWFILVGVLICGYFVLDGMDLGVGVLYPFLGKSEKTKAAMIRSVGPIWDGNEVWLLTAGGALFAAFAPAYATSFSGFYLAIMLVLFGLIVRIIGLEFRYRDESKAKLFDILFFVGSLLPALLFGVAVGNVIGGLPLNENGDYALSFPFSFLALLNPFALLCGVLGLVHMLTQGAAWLSVKLPTQDEAYDSAVSLRSLFAKVELVVFALTTVLFFAFVLPAGVVSVGVMPLAVVFALVYVATTVGNIVQKKDLLSVILAGVGCAGLVGIMASTLFPNLIPAVDPNLSITIATAASSDTTLGAMTIIACIGVPLVLVYHVIIYRVFRGRIAD